MTEASFNQIENISADAKALALQSLQRSLILSTLPNEEPFPPVHPNWRSYASFHYVNALAAGHNELWAATWGGIVRWRFEDGSRTLFTRFGSEHGLPGSHFQCIAIDNHSRVCVGGPQIGFSTFDGERWRTLTTEDGLPSNNILCISNDAQGRVWVATSRGLGYVALATGAPRWRQRPLGAIGMPAEEAHALLVDTNDDLWLGTDWGLYQVSSDDRSRRYTILDGLPALQVTQIQQDPTGCIWIGTVSGLCKMLDGHVQVIQEVREPVWNLSLDVANNSVWLVLPSGIYSYNAANGLQRIDLFPTVLSGAEGRSVVTDTSGIKWFGYVGNVAQPSPNRALLSDEGYDRMTNGENTLCNSVTAVRVDAVGRVWAGTPEGLWYLEDGIWRKSLPAELGGSIVNVDALEFMSKTKDLWVGGWQDGNGGTGLRRLIGTTGVPFVGQPPEMPYVDALAVSPEGVIWIAAQDQVVRFDVDGWALLKSFPGEYTDAVIHCLAADQNNTLWCGTTRGLWRFDHQWHLEDIQSEVTAIAATNGGLWVGTPAGLKYRSSSPDATWLDKVTDIEVTAIVADEPNTVWIGTSSGLIRLEEEEIAEYSTMNSGLASDFVQSLCIDKHTLWIGTANGLSRLAIDKGPKQ